MASGGVRNPGIWTSQGQKAFAIQHGRWNRECARVPGLGVVPRIATSSRSIGQSVTEALALLKAYGSFAAPGFMRPEGVVAYHTAARAYFKATIEGDETGKSYGA